MVPVYAAQSPQNFRNCLLFGKSDRQGDTKTFGKKLRGQRAPGWSKKWTLALHLISGAIPGKLIHFLVSKLLHVKQKIRVTNTNGIL